MTNFSLPCLPPAAVFSLLKELSFLPSSSLPPLSLLCIHILSFLPATSFPETFFVALSRREAEEEGGGGGGEDHSRLLEALGSLMAASNAP